MTVFEAQHDISRAYVGGGPGVLVSVAVWFLSAWVEAREGVSTAFAVLFVGGMLIYPVSTLVSRFAFGRGKEAPANPMGPLALESTVAMIGGLLAAWLFLRYQPAYVFPLAAVAVGTHYAAFKTVYGDRLFWLLGALITLAGLAAILKLTPLPGGPVLLVALIELCFGVLLTWRAVGAGETVEAL